MNDDWYFISEGKCHNYVSFEEARQGKKELINEGKVCTIIMCRPKHCNG